MVVLLVELEVQLNGHTTMVEDNQGAIVSAPEGVHNSKHVAIRRNFIQSAVKNNLVRIQYGPMNEMNGEILTKLRPRARHD